MGTVVFIYAVGISDYALNEELRSGKTAFSAALETARSFPGVERLVLLTDRSPKDFEGIWPGDLGPVASKKYRVPSDIFETMREESGEAEHLFYIWGDTPLIDPELSRRMFSRHVKYFASYTFADGFPLGLAPEILRSDVLGQLIELAGRNSAELGRSMLFDVVQKDINAFDLETEVSPKDLRLHRALLAADTRRNTMLLNAVMEKGGTDADSVVKVVDEHQEVLRTLPAYLQVQITEGCPQSCSYCPYPKIAGDVTSLDRGMELERWKALLDDAEACCDDLVVGIGLWGEPALHPRIAEFVEALLSHPRFSAVIETSGVGWKADALKRIAELDDGRVDWIVSLDAASEETYRKLRGEQWEEALAAISMMRDLFPDSRVHVQAVRIHENEVELESFYRYWSNEGVPLIVQKYDNFCGYLPDRKVTDLSPLSRFACIHLKRDLTVLLDGTVRMCREDLEGKYSLGNIFEDGIETLWKRMAPYYLRHISGELPELCEKCDEYYTFNF